MIKPVFHVCDKQKLIADMASHTELGREENVGLGVIPSKQGFSIIESNWRHGHWEIDLVATRTVFCIS